VLENGMTIPFMSEFLTNRDSESENDSLEKIKQDCGASEHRLLVLAGGIPAQQGIAIPLVASHGVFPATG